MKGELFIYNKDNNNEKISFLNPEKNEIYYENKIHDLKSHLTVILICTKYILENQNINKDERNYLNKILKSSKLMENIICNDNIFDIKYQNLNFILNEVSEYFNPLFNNKNIKFNVICNFKNIQINTDIYSFKNILYNLLNNAYKYTNINGSVEIVVEIDSSLKIYVKDNGCGIDKEITKNIFNRYNKNENYNDSTGLGLNIVIANINKLNYKIKYNTSDSGTTFIIIIDSDNFYIL